MSIQTCMSVKIYWKKYHRTYINRIGGIGLHLTHQLVVSIPSNFRELITGQKYGLMAIQLPTTKKWPVCMSHTNLMLLNGSKKGQRTCLPSG